jgi:hypothetical protein
VGLAAVFAVSFVLAGRIATLVARRTTRPAPGPDPSRDPIARLLVVATRPAPRARQGRVPAWRRLPRWRALWSKDLLLARRSPAVRRRAWVSVLFAALSVACWWIDAPPALLRVLAFGLALLAAATFGEWLIGLAGEDPFAILRALPVGLGDLWRSRMAWGVSMTIALTLGQISALRLLTPAALELFLIWTAAASALFTMLATHYGITLYPRADAAQRVYSLTLGIAIAASLMIPLMGWVTLLAAVLHSARRLPRWSRLDPTT